MPQQTITAPAPSLIDRAAACLTEPNPQLKCIAVAALCAQSIAPRGTGRRLVVPGRPCKPALVHPRDLPSRQLGTRDGHGAFVHAICHIEFTAINLALDAVVRFEDMPQIFYADWIAVAGEEANHFAMLARHLESLGYTYGDFTAHDGLWDMAERTADDVLRRMALVPRVMEARGLDVAPGMMTRLRAIGDEAGARILERILDDEIGHVRIGSHWFEYVCHKRGLEPVACFAALVAAEFGPKRARALNRPARRAAGFSDVELDFLSRVADTVPR